MKDAPKKPETVSQDDLKWARYLEGIERDEACKKLTLEQQIKLMQRYGYEWPVR